ncbi:KGGVGR-motif variant AAA ATPase [Chryseobacterium sp. G0201]|uniref:KGGVGR-motif variant AAA ATPase n=1 Tax=Chryseobacterium sp. G0201 TaxID=2487065 RepID=UPI000F4D50EB|nr:hypothetical protein [Chryseobacterium sp. G0201]AZA54081.1 hypothetical protein EG348_14275 [Chryseobacterium sp. G0201]
MILLFQGFDLLAKHLKEEKDKKKINKYSISINQRNEIEIIVITDNEFDKENIESVLPSIDFIFFKISNDELNEDYFYSQKFQKYGDEIIEYENSRRKLTNLLNPGNDFMPDIPVITYYSYKGGMGRSTNLVLTTTHLARNYNKKIVIIDCDFEAPGFSNFFLEEPSSPRNQNGLIEYLFDKELSPNINLNEYSWEVSKEYSSNGEIRIIPAGNLDIEEEVNNDNFPTNLNQYLEGLSRLDFTSTDKIITRFKLLIKDIQDQYSPDAIFIDSRTGFTDIFGITALHLSSQIVGIFGNSVQNNPGIYQFIDSIKSLTKIKKDFNPPIIINAFSNTKLFDKFKKKINTYIEKNDSENETFLLSPEYFHFRYDSVLSELGTSDEDKETWISMVDSSGFLIGYKDVSEKLIQYLHKEEKSERDQLQEASNYTTEKNNPSLNLLSENSTSVYDSKIDFPETQQKILLNLQEKWPNLYADSENVDYQIEFDEKRIFYRDSMKDLFNFNKFIVLGNKGTGKSYLFQALKNDNITNELKAQAQKSNLKIDFLHLVDKKDNYFISTKGLESFKQDIDKIGDFYTKFWKIYTWKSIIDKINPILNFNSSIKKTFSIKNNDTENLKLIVEFIQDLNNIIAVEKELEEIDSLLNSMQTDIIAIYDNLDLMVEPYKWKDEMSSLINFWQFSNYKRIHCKLFLRSDLYKTIRGINNVQSLKNSIISIEWQKEEIFNYFFNLVKQYAKEEFIDAVDSYDFKKISNDALEWKREFEKKFTNEKQHQFDENILRKLCWVFFGQYPDIKAHGESYDWLYKNVMNADETISIRPFLDLLSLSIKEYTKDYYKDSSSVLPEKYYTAKPVRSEAVKSHFEDLITEKGNENLEYIFEFIDKNEEYQYYQLMRNDLYDLLNNVISKYNLDTTIEDLEDLLIINGIIKQIGNFKYSFAFLYKYRLGLKSRKRRR